MKKSYIAIVQVRKLPEGHFCSIFLEWFYEIELTVRLRCMVGFGAIIRDQVHLFCSGRLSTAVCRLWPPLSSRSGAHIRRQCKSMSIRWPSFERWAYHRATDLCISQWCGVIIHQTKSYSIYRHSYKITTETTVWSCTDVIKITSYFYFNYIIYFIW